MVIISAHALQDLVESNAKYQVILCPDFYKIIKKKFNGRGFISQSDHL